VEELGKRRRGAIRWLLKTGSYKQLLQDIREVLASPLPTRGRPLSADDFEFLSIDDEPDGAQIVTFRLNGVVYLTIVHPRWGKARPGPSTNRLEALRELATKLQYEDADATARRWLQHLPKRGAKK
jgi:hypothetical protein